VKRGWCGPNRCSLCKCNAEMVQHMFIEFPFAQLVWDTIEKELNLRGMHPRDMLSTWVKRWKEKSEIKIYISTPFSLYIFSGGHTIVSFSKIRVILVEVVVGLVIKLVGEHKPVQ
jgi:hypothetical protein